MISKWFGRKKGGDAEKESNIELNAICETEKPKPENRFAKIKLSGEHYAEIESHENGDIRIRLEQQMDMQDCDCAVILVSEATKKKVICPAEKTGDAYVANISNIKESMNGGREIFRCYFAACGEKVKMGFRLWTKTEPTYDDSYLSTIQPDLGRYGAMVPMKSVDGVAYVAVPYKLEYSDKVSILVDKEEKCKKLCKGELKIISERKNYIYSYRFSVVMAVYNAEEFLREAIDSVINQDIGFKKSVQLILVDDGSTDNSSEICDEYARKFPDNVLVIHKENGGVSTARNEGKKYASGKYVNFMDSDDMFETNVFSKVWDYFEKYVDETDVVTIPLYLFGDEEGEYWQNYKFEKGTRVIDLRKEYTVSCMHVNASFIKNEMAKSYVFDENLPIAEDLKFMIQILINKFTLGVLHDCRYMYRKRNNGIPSLVKASATKKVAYNGYLQYVTKYLMDLCEEKFGYVPLYVQNTLMMDLQWKLRLKEFPEGVLTEDEEQAYIDELLRLTTRFDDEVILAQRIIFWELKFFLLANKYKEKLRREEVFKDILFTVNGKVIRCVSQMKTAIEIFYIEDGILHVEGCHTLYGINDEEQIATYLCIGDRLLECSSTDRKVEKETIVGKTARAVTFGIALPISEEIIGKKISIYIAVNNHVVVKRNVKYNKLTPFYNRYENEYYVKDNYVVVHDKSTFTLKRINGVEERAEYENRLIEEIKSEAGQTPDAAILETLQLREEYFQRIAQKEKEIWLISDRVNAAGDNGEALFMWLQKKAPRDIDIYFVISQDCPDYERIGACGRVVAYKSHEHLILTLLADKVISAHADEFIRDVFLDSAMHLRDLYSYKYVFLQHGVTQNDLSDWLGKYKKNIALFVTTARQEQQSIIEGNYYYSEKEVKLTGFPRFDLLVQKEAPEKQLVFMPTWRKYLATEVDTNTGIRAYYKLFKETEYYQFYQGLLSNERLLEAMRKNGYTGRFIIHPALRENSVDFVGNDVFRIVTENVSYREEFIKNALLITDYSSVAFDFAYLKKPIIYTQFDREYMYRNHICSQGYWDYDTMGFGPVCRDQDETVNAILRALERECVLEPEYMKRIEEFYYKFDQHNCERVYEAIRNM